MLTYAEYNTLQRQTCLRLFKNMKNSERAKARTLRQQGYSINEILREVQASKGSVSTWICDLPLTEDQLSRLQDKRSIAVEKFSVTMLAKREVRTAHIHQEARAEYQHLCKNPKFMFGLALYVGEGTKYGRGMLVITNCNPAVIRCATDFFMLIGFPREKLRVRINLHPFRDVKQAESYWRRILLARRVGYTARSICSNGHCC